MVIHLAIRNYVNKMLWDYINNNRKNFTTSIILIDFMSFCRILSTLCRQVVFHIVPHFGKIAGQKVQRKIAAAVQKVKSSPLFVPLFWNQRNKLSTIILFVLVIKLTKDRRRRVWRGRTREGEIRDGEIWEGGCEYRLSLLKPNLRKM